MKFDLPALPYEYAALEPFLDEQTMCVHHDKHHAAYVAKLNDALATHPEIPDMTIEAILSNISLMPEDIRVAVQNHGGGHFNHSLFWKVMGPPAKEARPSGRLAAMIDRDFGSFASFAESFSKTALGVFGSGWAWLVKIPEGKLAITATANQTCPLSGGQVPLLPLDVWEHAYYLKYQNRRADFIAAWWSVVDWAKVAEEFEKAFAQ